VKFNNHASAARALASPAVPLLAKSGLAWDGHGRRHKGRGRRRGSQPMSFKRIGNSRLEAIQSLLQDRSPRPRNRSSANRA